MSRRPVHVRDATPEDADALLALWADFSRRAYTDKMPVAPPQVEAAHAVARIAASSDERLVVAVLDDELVGLCHLIRAALSPLHAESAVHVTHLHVAPASRRHGVGRALLETAVTWAEEKDTTHVIAAAPAHSRDANRFLARLGLAQVAVVRGASVSALRAKLPVDPPAAARCDARTQRSVGQVLVQRRLQRRSREQS